MGQWSSCTPSLPMATGLTMGQSSLPQCHTPVPVSSISHSVPPHFSILPRVPSYLSLPPQASPHSCSSCFLPVLGPPVQPSCQWEPPSGSKALWAQEAWTGAGGVHGHPNVPCLAGQHVRTHCLWNMIPQWKACAQDKDCDLIGTLPPRWYSLDSTSLVFA